MTTIELAGEIIATYQRHGWQLRRVLLTSPASAEIGDDHKGIFGDVAVVQSDLNALWFARPSHARREAWELRLLSEQRYALFEAFEADEQEEDREDARQEMENKMRDYATAS